MRMTLQEVLQEWLRGCSLTTLAKEPPWHCNECTAAMLRALALALDPDETPPGHSSQDPTSTYSDARSTLEDMIQQTADQDEP